jgi:dihydroxyacetone kinase-like protein
MQKLINDPAAVVDEMLEGILKAHPNSLMRVEDLRAVARADAPVMGKVGIATGGGSGHLPLFLGYVGDGLADGAAVGDVFASPSTDQMLAVTRAVDGGRGVLHLYGNYGGDRMNFDLAAELAAAEGIEVMTVRGADDVASAPRGEQDRRRGIAGIFFLYKVAGAAAAEGRDLAGVHGVVSRAAGVVRSIGVALSACTVPAAGRPTFEVPEGQMEIGMGIHGEPGISRGDLEPVDDVVDTMVDALLSDLPHERGDHVDVLVNGLGATPAEELYIAYRRLHERLAEAGLEVRRPWIGEYATALEMSGLSISLMVSDDELARLMDAPATSPLLTRL